MYTVRVCYDHNNVIYNCSSYMLSQEGILEMMCDDPPLKRILSVHSVNIVEIEEAKESITSLPTNQ
jgi:hypothetical protein